ncbi:hypothetical protein FF011L_34470 [Roseimaritima multifibrata]|uniref:Uncharacterized protein n=1 Tax=Roseimaritima multifibrata TaxID=1930274 RepID=A0A517MIP3_9BACT|nr:hypothetical protein FF011L_34470 [Roseimaritima multifibrata]
MRSLWWFGCGGDFGVLEFWSFGVLEFWSFGVLEFWSFGVLGKRRSEVKWEWLRSNGNWRLQNGFLGDFTEKECGVVGGLVLVGILVLWGSDEVKWSGND